MGQDNLQTLYEHDFQGWIEQTIRYLEAGQFDLLDAQHLIEELEDLGKRDKNRVESFLRQIIIHLLLLQYWTTEYEYNYRHWQGEIATFRVQLNRSLTTNLKQHLLDNREEIYQESIFMLILSVEAFLLSWVI